MAGHSLLLAGFGHVARRLAELLLEYQDRLLGLRCTGITTLRHGSIVNPDGIDLTEALERVRAGGSLENLPGAIKVSGTMEAIELGLADILVETTPLNARNGQPAIDYARSALEHGLHVVTANKGPQAFAHRELRNLASERGLALRYESSVLDGTPIFNLFQRTLPLVEVFSISGIINSTTNYILSQMERGVDYSEALREAQRRGIAEADPSLDTEGWDAAVKLAVLANCLMHADLRPSDVKRTRLEEVSPQMLAQAQKAGRKVRLIARVRKQNGVVMASVAPEEVATESVFYSVDAFSNAIVFETDLMGALGLVEVNPNLTQTAYGLLSDILSI